MLRGLTLVSMEIHVLDHPLVEHKLTVLRDKNTSSATFRELVSELVMLETYEATRNIDVVDCPIETPICPMVGKKLFRPSAPDHRAGAARRPGHARRHDPHAADRRGRVPRHEARRGASHAADHLRERLPDDLTGRQCFLIDPMLATGGTLVAATHYLAERGAKDVTAVCILAAPEGIEFVEKNIDPSIDFKVVVCAVDEALNEKAYIVPGLGRCRRPPLRRHRLSLSACYGKSRPPNT